MDHLIELQMKGKNGKQAARKLATLSTLTKNQALEKMAEALEKEYAIILAANAIDIENGKGKGLSQALLDRLLLTQSRIEAMADGLRQVITLPDPIGELLSRDQRPNGLEISKVRVPLGVIGIIYEARPNVTVDAAGLCLKTGNAVILRGGSEAIHSNKAIIQIIAQAAYEAGIPAGSLQLVETTDRQAVNEMLKLNEYLDVIIPRGGAGLIKTVVENSTVPVIETGTGICHTFVDESADLKMAEAIAFNAKVSRPGVCNSMETLLVHEKIAKQFLPEMLEKYQQAGVELRGCPITIQFHQGIKSATDEDWATEYSDFILSVKVVKNLDEAIEHIDQYSTRHSEAIVTKSLENAKRFQHEVDAAAVYVNASTRFTDGFEFGFGAEIGISTQKLHARGPMGLPELTSSKYIISGNGQIRE
ncbi:MULTISPECIES: glutamate-5-semialdehyde dehydrogenase [Pelosinus]|uniref:Gamma-glutamyl phosphate reductase n=1 Tax=Pelosinus fermentans B4 TaxID=1149862 RepID=I9L9R8_9FIRM|nr:MULTISPECIES: glutamate-5-semialdehyde dehydrogenase [Pelosinus]EIW17041.1 gamma-glutamyl phosphate reductase [Pelosinus fermentans B4]EIW23160.1 Gamma-glutamyl phosphate reductase [Pelosinus fermentans A11]OAM93797.1 Gamma-glutamyl phosphate reductase [Pelosinus fermentans DSM 17108]SDQ90417.1 glutamate-5-semialdehyde dehydrogenase [Pelosinus fermentans]